MITKLLYNILPRQEEVVCNLCFSRRVSKETGVFTKENKTPFNLSEGQRTQQFILCANCGYSFCPGNYIDDRIGLEKPESSSKPGKCARIGDGITPGREYFMAMNAVSILKKRKLKVLIFSPGFNRDHELIRKKTPPWNARSPI